jgi:hypothetical protein
VAATSPPSRPSSVSPPSAVAGADAVVSPSSTNAAALTLLSERARRVADAAERSGHISTQRLERCGGAMFGGCSFCKYECFHIKQGVQAAKGGLMGGGTGARQKGQCFKCRKETLRCTTLKCNEFTECVQSSGGDAAKDEAKCAVCRKEVQHWEREDSDDMFDYTRAEGYVKTEEENAKKEERIETRSHHLGLKVLKHQESAEVDGQKHTNYIVEVRLGLGEPYHVEKRFSEFKQLGKDLLKMRYKPKEVEKEAGGQFLAVVPTDWYQVRELQPKHLDQRRDALNGWCTELANWATALMNPRSPTAEAFVDLLRSVGSEEERAALEKDLLMQEHFKPVRGFFRKESDDEQSVQTASTSPAAAPVYQGGGGGGRRTSVSSWRSDMEEEQVAPVAPPPRHSHSASANVYQPEPEPEPEPELAEVDERPEEEEVDDTDSVEVTVYSEEAHERKTPHPVTTVAALRAKWKAGEVDDKTTYIWMDHEMFVDADGWQPLGSFVDVFGFPPKSRAV